MRLLISLNDQKQGYALSAYLTSEGIENKLESSSNTDWGSAEYGAQACKIWVIDEDQFAQTQQIASDFVVNPEDPRFYKSTNTPVPPLRNASAAAPFTAESFKGMTPKPAQAPIPKQQPMGVITFYLLLVCTLLLLVGEFSSPTITRVPPGNIPLTPLIMPTLYKDLLFDYPQAFETIDKIAKAYGIESLNTPQDMLPEAKILLAKFYQTPYWEGYYDLYMQEHQSNTVPLSAQAPLFEKIKEGEIWRIFTPCLLHANILHLLFNMMWLVILGRQMEFRLGKFRYALFILVVGSLANCCQYLMSGPNFLGFSGVVCGMLAYIWIRRKKAPWEGYQLQPGTIGFIAFFILLMLGIQIASFLAEYFFHYALSPGIANTAHLVGALTGYLLGKSNYFAWKIS